MRSATFPSSDLNPNFTYVGTYPIYNVGLQYVHTFNPSMVNELRLGTDLEHVKQLSTLANTAFTPASIGINGFVQPNGSPFPPPDQGFPVISSSDLIDVGSGTAASNLDDSRTYQVGRQLHLDQGQAYAHLRRGYPPCSGRRHDGQHSLWTAQLQWRPDWIRWR